MKKLKLDYLFISALLLGGGLAVASNQPAAKSKTATQVWVRTASASESAPDDNFGWSQGSASDLCDAAQKICKAEFQDGYDPNLHSYEDNQENNLSSSVETGIVRQP